MEVDHFFDEKYECEEECEHQDRVADVRVNLRTPENDICY